MRHALLDLVMNKFFALIAVFVLSSCGFHLKGYYPTDHLPVQKWSIEGGVLQNALKKAVRRASGELVERDAAEAQLRILSVDSKKDVYTITRAAKLNEYLLSMRVSAQAYRHNQPWGQPMYVQVRRVMPYSDSQILGKDVEEQTIWGEMRDDAAMQLVQQLGYLQ